MRSPSLFSTTSASALMSSISVPDFWALTPTRTRVSLWITLAPVSPFPPPGRIDGKTLLSRAERIYSPYSFALSRIARHLCRPPGRGAQN